MIAFFQFNFIIIILTKTKSDFFSPEKIFNLVKYCSLRIKFDQMLFSFDYFTLFLCDLKEQFIAD